MILGIMQPYFFPYIGYWQLMNAVDEYLIIDDVNYIKNGFINRNKILVNGEPFNFGVSVKKASQNKLILDHEHGLDVPMRDKLLSTLRSAYAKALFFKSTYDFIEEVFDFGLTPEGRNLADFLFYANVLTAKKLGITTPILRTSKDVHLDGEYKKENLVVAICKNRGASDYYNSIGGTALYTQSFFNENGLGLKFIKTNSQLEYKQWGNKFIPNLSIIDIMMFCSDDQIKELLLQYSLIDE